MTEEEIIAALRASYDAFHNCDFKEFRKILTFVRAEIDKYPQTHPLQGEWILVQSLPFFAEPAKLVEMFGAAYALIGGRSKVFSEKISMSLDFYNVFGIYYRTGRADEIAELLDKASALFEKLTGGGTETALCYRAQLAHYRGESEKALALAEKAYDAARQNGNYLIALCAAELVGNLAKHAGNEKLWHKMMSYIDGVIEDPKRRRICTETAEVIRAEANMHIGVFKDMPEYVKTGDFGAIHQPKHPLGFVIIGNKISPTLLYYAGISHIQYLFYTKQYIEAINKIGVLRNVWRAAPQPFSDAYLDLLLASNYRMLGDMESAYFCVSSAIEKIAPDGLWLIPSEFVLTSMGSYIIETVEKHTPGAGNTVRDLGIDYWNKIDDLRSIVHRESLVSALNDREYEVALLAADRLSTSEIAEQLFISESTVKFHLSNIYGKLGIRKKTEIAAALEKKLTNKFSLMQIRKEW
ncbi:MAG: LuxR family transcriptional regulator [Clostridia bacterium]|nr:LuxR family transcriptional regulator [Clostridia bacterium]